MKCFKYLDIPGIDKIGGNRPAEDFYKIVSSSANNWDKSYVMSETYGAMGNLSWNQMMSIAMDQYAKGINMLIPHAVWYDNHNVTFKPELSQRNPIYRDSLKIFNLFLSRLNVMLQNKGRHVADIAVLYPISTLQGEHYFDGPLGYYKGGVDIPNTDYVDVAKWLTNVAGKDYTFLHPEVLDEKCEIIDRRDAIKNREDAINNRGDAINNRGDARRASLHLENRTNWEDFRILIVPSCKTIKISNLQKIKSFYDRGGMVIFTTQLPSKSVEHGKDNEVLKLINAVFPLKDSDKMQVQSNSQGGKAFYIPKPDGQLLRQILEHSGLTFDVNYPENEDLRYLHKVIDNRNVFYIANIGRNSVDSSVSFRGDYRFEGWDPHTGEISVLNSDVNQSSGKDSNSTILQLKLKPYHSLFIVENQ